MIKNPQTERQQHTFNSSMARASDNVRGKSQGKNHTSAVNALGLFKKVVDGFK